MMLAERVGVLIGDRLASHMGERFERRDCQTEMAVAVARTVAERGVLVVEAGTGVGKTLAYLLPLVEHVRASGARVVVSTHTRTLQRQLMENDFPVASATVGGACAAAVLTGRAGYVCKRGVESQLKKEKRDLARARWLRGVLSAETGDIESLPDASRFLDRDTRREISAPRTDAICRGCRLRDECFLFRARRLALSADIVFANHALLFSDLEADGALLGPYDILVLDESHHLENAATSFFSLAYGERAVRGSQESVYTAEYEETVAYARAMAPFDDAHAMELAWNDFNEAVRTADEETRQLFDRVSENASRSGSGENTAGSRIVYAEGSPLLYSAVGHAGAAADALNRMATAAAALGDVVNGVEALSETGVPATIGDLAAASREHADVLRYVSAGSGDEHVFFAERDANDRVVGLCAAPFDVSAQLGAIISERAESVVLTSATLSVGEDFGYALERFGLAGDNRVTTARFDSPFDPSRRRVVLAGYLPAPADQGFERAAARTLADVYAAFPKRFLVLCTSAAQLRRLETELIRAGLSDRVYAQREGAARADLLDRFKRDPGGILVGLASFWEGVDLPGEFVEVVAVMKLPFLVPNDPIVRARSERLTSIGENAFEKLFLPDVVLKLRQGMGRLIRSGTDRGAVLLFDRRLADSPYGGFVMDAVAPHGFVGATSDADVVRSVGDLFTGAASTQ